jgi:hypothetical protein
VPVPTAFDGVTDLGAARAIYERNNAILLPGFGAPKTLILYQKGFAYHTGGKDIYTWRWDEISTILSDITSSYGEHGRVSENHAYTLVKKNGEKFVVSDVLESVEKLIEAIKSNVFALLLPPLTQHYNSGQAITFGPITIHRQNGLQTGGKTYAWADIIDIKVDRGRFIVTTRDNKKREARVSNIPNVEMLCRLIGLELLPTQLTYY